jgi:hypothetical protein
MEHLSSRLVVYAKRRTHFCHMVRRARLSATLLYVAVNNVLLAALELKKVSSYTRQWLIGEPWLISWF